MKQYLSGYAYLQSLVRVPRPLQVIGCGEDPDLQIYPLYKTSTRVRRQLASTATQSKADNMKSWTTARVENDRCHSMVHKADQQCLVRTCLP